MKNVCTLNVEQRMTYQVRGLVGPRNLKPIPNVLHTRYLQNKHINEKDELRVHFAKGS